MPASALTASPLTQMFGTIADWVREQWAARHAALELDACGQEVDRIAHDVGLSTYELRQLARHAPREAKLLNRRMAVLHLDPHELERREGGVMQDLQRLCTQCASQRRCAGALDREPENREWLRYCPNAGTLNVLQARWPGAAA